MKPATHVMILSVYGVEAALEMVRFHAESRLEGITFGNSDRNSIATAAITGTPDSANAQPSRPIRFMPSAATRATTATIIATSVLALPLSTWVQARKATASTAVARPTLVASALARP